MSNSTRGDCEKETIDMGKKSTVKKGMHVWAKIGSALPKKQVYVKSIRGNTAHISWHIGKDVVDAHINKKHLSPLRRE